MLDAGNVESLEKWILAESVTEAERVALGQHHPALMGGEYLPGYQDEEVEIARVSLQSTTGDVISIRARRDRGAIRYRVVDEYGTRLFAHRRRAVSRCHDGADSANGHSRV